MKILHCIDSLKSGGTPTVLKTLIKALRHHDKSVEHVVVYLHDGPVKDMLHELKVKTLQIKPLLPRYDITLLPRFMKIIHREKPDLTHTVMTNSLFFGRLASWLMRVPNVSGIHENMNYVGRFSQYGMRLMGNMVTRYIAISQHAKKCLIPFQKKSFQPTKVTVINNGLDLQFIRTLATQKPLSRSEVGLDESAFIVGGVGRFSPEKSFDVLIKSFAQLKERTSCKVQLCLVGYGPQEQEFRELCATLGITDAVVFAGHQANPFPFYPLFDTFVLSSQTEGGTPLVVLEAMAFGVPVVMTHHQATHPTIQQGKTGFFVPVNDHKQLADKLYFLATNKTTRRAIGQAGKTLVEQRNSAAIMAEQYLTVFKQAAHPHKNSV